MRLEALRPQSNRQARQTKPGKNRALKNVGALTVKERSLCRINLELSLQASEGAFQQRGPLFLLLTANSAAVKKALFYGRRGSRRFWPA